MHVHEAPLLTSPTLVRPCILHPPRTGLNLESWTLSLFIRTVHQLGIWHHPPLACIFPDAMAAVALRMHMHTHSHTHLGPPPRQVQPSAASQDAGARHHHLLHPCQHVQQASSAARLSCQGRGGGVASPHQPSTDWGRSCVWL
eukprot:365203-Chlamydomonas_euryale.AAC.14